MLGLGCLLTLAGAACIAPAGTTGGANAGSVLPRPGGAPPGTTAVIPAAIQTSAARNAAAAPYFTPEPLPTAKPTVANPLIPQMVVATAMPLPEPPLLVSTPDPRNPTPDAQALAQSSVPFPDVPRAPIDVAQRMIAEGAVIGDVRTLNEYRQGHLPGAILLAAGSTEGPVQAIPKDAALILYCA